MANQQRQVSHSSGAWWGPWLGTALGTALVTFAATTPLPAQEAGDVNGDGKTDQADLALVEQYLDGSKLLVEEQSRRADLTADGVVDRRDLNALRRRLGLAVAEEPQTPTLSGRANTDKSRSSGQYRASAQGATFQLNLEEVVPEWVRGSWRFNSRVLETQGGFGGSSYQQEQISLPGDLSGKYVTQKVSTGERLDRLCWEVKYYDDQRFTFEEQLRDQSGAIYASTADITNRGSGRADITIRVDVLDAGRAGSNVVGGLLGFFFGGGRPGMGMGGLQSGDYYVRGGPMERLGGSERDRLPNVDLAALRCNRGRSAPRGF